MSTEQNILIDFHDFLNSLIIKNVDLHSCSQENHTVHQRTIRTPHVLNTKNLATEDPISDSI